MPSFWSTDNIVRAKNDAFRLVCFLSVDPTSLNVVYYPYQWSLFVALHPSHQHLC